MTTFYENDVFDHIQSDLKKIRIKSGMYIGYAGWRASNHLARELIQNSIDECVSPKSPANVIDIVYDENTKILKVSDNGRGIPIDSLLVVTCSLNSGSKFSRSQGGSTAGENGVGIKAVAALSEDFVITSFNNGNSKSIRFHEGELKDDNMVDMTDNHGLLSEFKPSVEALGKDPWIHWKELVSWIRDMSYLITKDITFNLTNGTTTKIKTSDFKDIVNIVVDKKHLSTQPLYLSDTTQAKESYFGKSINRTVNLSVILAYTTTESKILSFVNYVNTYDHGSHVDGVKETICRYLLKSTQDNLTDKDKKVIQDLKWSDVLDGMCIIVNLSTDYSPGFASQSKSKIDKEDILQICKSMMSKMLVDGFTNNSKLLSSFISRIKINAKARLSVNRTKEQLFKSLDRYDEAKVDHYKRCTGDGDDKEIFLIEGDSAMNAASAVRDTKNQALFGMIGIPANGMKKNDDTIFKNERFDSLVKILGCGRGKHFNLANLKFKKIIMLTDADVDGYYIRSLFSGFFMTYFPDIVRDGRLYAAIPPLYRIKLDGKKRNKDDDLVTDKLDYMEMFNKSLSAKYKLSINGKTLSNEELMLFLYDAKWYLEDLNVMSDMFKSNKKLIELLLYIYAINNVDVNNFNDYIHIITDEFKHVKYEQNTHIVYGVIDGKYQSITLGSLLFNKGENYCVPLMRKYNSMYLDVNVSNSVHRMTIGEFLELIEPDKPKILTRFKGLGEFEDRTDLEYTTMNPNTRSLLQLVTTDYDNDMAILGILHGTSNEERQARKIKVHDYIIDKDQIDN